MKITLKTLGKTFDITNHVDQSQTMVNSTLDGMFNTGKIVLTAMKFDELGSGIDLERRIPVYSIVEIEALDKTHQFYVKSDDVNKHNNKYATHTVELVELKSLLGERPIPDIAVTQPTGETLNYVSEASKVLSGTQSSTQNWRPLNLELTAPSNDATIIDNRVLKQAKTYSISADITMNFSGSGGFNVSGGFAITINGTPVEIIPFTSMPNVPDKTFNLSLDHYANVGDVVGFYYWITATYLVIRKGTLRISIEDTSQGDPIYLDTVVEKVLRLHNVSNQNEYLLDQSSKARLSTILAYDTMETQQTQLSLLEKIASYVKARLSVYIRDNQKYVEFQFYDEMEQVGYNEVHRDTQVARTENTNHYSGLSVEVENVITNKLIIEPRQTLRPLGDDTALMTTDNICIKTSQPIDKIAHIWVYNAPIYSSGGGLMTNVTIIDKRIIERPHYDVLNKMADYSDNGRRTMNQNNTLFYVRGDNKIYGLSNVGELGTGFFPNTGNRAFYETIYASFQNSDDGVGSSLRRLHDTNGDLDKQVMVQVAYYPMTRTNALVTKTDQANFEEKTITRLNSSSRVNQIDFLGNYAKGRIDSMGGTEISFYGDTKTVDGLPIVGTVDSQGYRLITLTQQVNPIATSFVATIVKDHVFQSNYIGIDSDRRLYEIPKDEYVLRVDKNYQLVNISTKPLPIYGTLFNPRYFFLNVITNHESVDTVALMVDDREVTCNVLTQATANTIELFYRMQDNYSVGFKLVNTNDKTYQLGVRYVDSFGRVNNIRGTYKRLTSITNVADCNRFPEGHFSGIDVGSFSYQVNKDPRECLAFSNQFIINSVDNDVIVYANFGKYVSNKNKKIRIATLHYKPTLDDITIDLGRSSVLGTGTVTVGENTVTTPIQVGGDGYAWYDDFTNELLLVVNTPVTQGTHQIYFNSEAYK